MGTVLASHALGDGGPVAVVWARGIVTTEADGFEWGTEGRETLTLNPSPTSVEGNYGIS